MLYACYDDPFEEEPIVEKIEEPHSEIKRTGRFFGGFWEDLQLAISFCFFYFVYFFNQEIAFLFNF